MTGAPSDTWSWIALAGLGAFHGLNPAMGWLFAVALALHRKDRSLVWRAPLPIAFGHALSITAMTGMFLFMGSVVDLRTVRMAGGILLIGWALYLWRYGHRHRVRFGMQSGLAALAIWSFLMATGHGAGLMLWPVLMPLCFSPGTPSLPGGPVAIALLGVGVHSLAMLAVTTVIAVAVYHWVGLEILRRAWINVDLLWTIALATAGGLLLLA